MPNHNPDPKPKRAPLPPHWYFTYTRECALCGAGETIRTRMFTPKPPNPRDRYDYKQFACDQHFM